MDYQNLSQENEPTQVKRPNTVWAIIATAIIAALLSGGGIYLLQAQRVKSLELQLSQVSQRLSALATKSIIETAKQPVTKAVNDDNEATTTNGQQKYDYTSWDKYNGNVVSFNHPRGWGVIAKIANEETVISSVNPGYNRGYADYIINIKYTTNNSSRTFDDILAEIKKDEYITYPDGQQRKALVITTSTLNNYNVINVTKYQTGAPGPEKTIVTPSYIYKVLVYGTKLTNDEIDKILNSLQLK